MKIIYRINLEIKEYLLKLKYMDIDNRIQLCKMKKVIKKIYSIIELCRICLCDDGNSDLISPCQCKGSTGYIHENCLKTWLLEK